MSRLVVLDTETTGLEVTEGHRIIEIGAVELVERRVTGENYHQYIQPERMIDAGAFDVHGISDESLVDKPLFSDILTKFVHFIDGSELIIHNAPFDVAFLNSELKRAGHPKKVEDYCKVTDSLALARKKYPGQRNSLDALCSRLEINNSHRKLHGALLDSEILADVYLSMTVSQEAMNFDSDPHSGSTGERTGKPRVRRPPTPVHTATPTELQSHQARLESIDKASGGKCRWSQDFPV